MPLVYRIEVRPKSGQSDPRAEAVIGQATALGLAAIPTAAQHSSVYLLAGEVSEADVRRIANELLADPVTQRAEVQPRGFAAQRLDAMVEIHPLPGVTDPAAESVESAVRAMFGTSVHVRTGDRYDLAGINQLGALTIGERVLANPVIHGVHAEPWHPQSFPAGHGYTLRIVEIPLRDLGDAALEKLRATYQRYNGMPAEVEQDLLARRANLESMLNAGKLIEVIRQAPIVAQFLRAEVEGVEKAAILLSIQGGISLCSLSQ